MNFSTDETCRTGIRIRSENDTELDHPQRGTEIFKETKAEKH